MIRRDLKPPVRPATKLHLAQWRETIYVSLAIGIVALFVCQVLVGTSVYFALCVAVYCEVALLTIRSLGFATVAGVFIALFAFRYVVLAEVMKTGLGQPGDSNLYAPATTISVLLVGMVSTCAAALVASHLLHGRRIISLNPSQRSMGFVRNLCLATGVVSFIVIRLAGVNDSGDVATGGIAAIARQFYTASSFGILVETWRVLTVTDRRKSLSPILVAMIALFTAFGFLENSKMDTAVPYLAYLVTAVVYRGRITRTQCAAALSGAVMFVAVIYPAIQILRLQRDELGVTTATVGRFLNQVVSIPDYFSTEWRDLTSLDQFDEQLWGNSVDYLGSEGESDLLLGRFLRIANTDLLIDAINQDGPIGWSMVGDAIGYSIPHFIYPGKTQVPEGDLVMWHYGFLPWGLVSETETGLAADSFAAAGWIGIVVFPFVLVLLLLAEMQLAGAKLQGNMISIYFAITSWGIMGADIQDDVAAILRAVPQQLAFIVGAFLLAEFFSTRRRRMLRPSPAAAAFARQRWSAADRRQHAQIRG